VSELNRKLKYFFIAAIISFALFVVMGIPTALLSNPFVTYKRMIPATSLDYFFLVAASLLLGTLISLKLYFNSRFTSKEVAAGIGSFIAFSCVLCNVLLVTLLGSALTAAFVEPLRPFLGSVSVLILVYLIYTEIKCSECRTGIKADSLKEKST
jgi:hypothetical protein